jgi:hypothetical protein
MLINDPEVYRPLGIVVLSFFGSFTLDSIETANTVLLEAGRFVTGMAMIISGGMTVYSIIKKQIQNERNKERED